MKYFIILLKYWFDVRIIWKCYDKKIWDREIKVSYKLIKEMKGRIYDISDNN